VYSKRKVNFDKIEDAITLLEEGSISNRKIASKVGLANTFVSAINRSFLTTGKWPERKKNIRVNLELEGDDVRFTLGKSKVPNKINIDKDFCRLIGYYLAEGSVDKHKNRANSLGIVLTFGKHEEDYIEDVSNLIEKIFKIKPHTITQESTTKVYLGNSVIGHLFKKLFGTGSKNKKINTLLNLKKELQLEILKGWIRGANSAHLKRSSKTIYVNLKLVKDRNVNF
jgi:DNA-binding transcriptional regulator WhiA